MKTWKAVSPGAPFPGNHISPHLPGHDSKRNYTRHIRRNTKCALYILFPNTPTNRKHNTKDQRNRKHDRHSQCTIQPFHEMETPPSNCINQIRSKRQRLLLSLRNVAKVERRIRRLGRAGSKEVHHVRGTNRRTFLDWWRRQEIVLVEGGREFVGQDVVDQVLGTKLELPFISTHPGL